MGEKIIVFAPHPDDETLGCGGTILKKAKEGYEVTIVIMTDGRYVFSSCLGINVDPTPAEVKAIRKEEVVRAAARLAVPKRNLNFLDFEDGSLWQNKEEVERRVQEILEKECPTEVYFPYRKDCHIDHRVANRIVSDSVARVISSASKYMYSIMRKYSRVASLNDRLLNVFRHNMIVVDISEFLPLKRAALEEFRSQLEIVSKTQKRAIILPARLRRHLRDKEIFYVK